MRIASKERSLALALDLVLHLWLHEAPRECWARGRMESPAAPRLQAAHCGKPSWICGEREGHDETHCQTRMGAGREVSWPDGRATRQSKVRLAGLAGLSARWSMSPIA